MKRIFCVCVCICALCASSVALAVSEDDYWVQDDVGNWYYDYDAYNAAVAWERVTADGYADEFNVDYFWTVDEYGFPMFDNDAFEAEYTAMLARVQEQEQPPAPETPPAEPPQDTVESVGSNDADETPPVDISTLTPIGNYFADEDGNLFDKDGKPAGFVPAGDLPRDDTLQDDVLDSEVSSTVPSVENSVPVYTVNDLRSAGDTAITPLVGLKAIVVSIFGEYTPVTTTTTVTETVGSETTTTLIDTVAEGAAGVDYEWCAGVLLFAVLLYCLLKLLGGVLK